MSADTNRKPPFMRRFWRALIGVLAIITFIALLVAIGVGGYLSYVEFQRIASRLNDSTISVSALRGEVDALRAASASDEEIDALEATITELEGQIATLQGDLAADVATQQTTLDALTEQINSSSTEVGTLSTNVTTLSEALAAIQGDVVDTGMRLDALGGEVDSVQTEVDSVETAVTDLGEEMIEMEEAAFAHIDAMSEQNQFQETLALFRAWELITRARLRLLENNIGLATEDIDAAIQTIEAVIALEYGTVEQEKLEMVLTRLALAILSLPDNPEAAAADLESAWDELDTIFTEQLLPDLNLPDTDALSDSSEEAEANDDGDEEATTEETDNDESDDNEESDDEESDDEDEG